MTHIIDTKCGKTMKYHIYKFHQKKCNICKGEKHNGSNIEFIENRCQINHGCSFKDLSKKKFKKDVDFGGLKKDEQIYAFNYFKDSLKEN